MEIQSPSGRVYNWDKPTPPTKEDMDALIAFDAQQSEPKRVDQPSVAEPLAAAARNIPAGVVNAVSRGDTSQLGSGLQSAGQAISNIPIGLPNYLGRGRVPTVGEAVSSPEFLRIAPPVAAAVMFPPTAIRSLAAEGAPAVSATIQALSGYASSKFAGDKPSEAIQNAIMSAYPGFGTAKVGNSVISDYLLNSAKEAFGMAGTVMLANVAKQATEQVPEVDWKSAFSGVGIPLALAPIAGSIRTFGARSEAVKQQVADARRALQESGIDTPTLGMLVPDQWARVESRIAQFNPELAAKINRVGKTATERYQALFGNAKSVAEIAPELGQYVGKLDEERAVLAKFDKKATDTQKALDAAKRSNAVDPADVAQLEKEVISSNMAAINQGARVMFYQNVVDSANNALKPISDTAKEFANSVDNIFTLRKQAADKLYKESGVDMTQEFIPAEQLYNAAKAALKDRPGPISEGILQSLKRDKGAVISVNEMRELRQRFADSFVSSDPKQMSNAEAIASKAYAAVADSAMNSVGEKFGADALQAFKKANDYWKETANAAQSRYLQSMLRNEPAVSVVETLGNDIANGRFEEAQGFLKFLNAVKQQAPDVGKLGEQALYRATRESFINRAIDADGAVDLGKLTTSLNLAARRGFPVETLGFGTPKQIENVKKTFAKFNPKGGSVSASDLDEFYANPVVQTYINAGKEIPKDVTAQVAAKQAFEKQVKEDLLRAKLGARPKNADVDLAYKESLAKEAKMDADAQRALVERLSKDPMFSVFENVTMGLPRKIGESGAGITQALRNMSPSKAQEIMTVMRRNRPELASDVEARVAADMFNFLAPETTVAGKTWRVDPDKVRQFFVKPLEGDTSAAVNTAKAVLSPDTFKRFEKTVNGFSQLSDYLRIGRGTSKLSDAELAGGLAYSLTNGKVTQANIAAAGIDRLRSLLDNRRYALVSKLMADPDAATAFFRNSNNTAKMFEGMAPQRAILIASDPEAMKDLRDSQNQNKK